MNRVIVRYRVKPDRLPEHEERIRAVFEELNRLQPAGLRYAAFRLDDGTTFVHLAVSADEPSPLSSVEAFRRFQENIGDRLDEQPTVNRLDEIGSFEFDLNLDGVVPESRRLEGAFEVTSWTEEEVAWLDGSSKVTKASIGQRLTGDIEADTMWDMVMTYRADGTAEFMGYQRLEGRVGDRRGTFVLKGVGEFDGGVSRTRLEVIPASARGDLAGLRGTGVAEALRGSTGTFSLDVRFE